MKLHEKLFRHALIGHLFIAFTLFLVLFWSVRGIIEEELLRLAEAEAKAIFNNLYQGMLNGFSKEHLEKIIANFQSKERRIVLRHRDELQENHLEDVLKRGMILRQKGEITYRYLISARPECLNCHKDINKNEPLGLLEVNHVYKGTLHKLTLLLITLFGVVTLLILGGIYLVGQRQAKALDKPIRMLIDRLRGMQKFKDLVEGNISTNMPLSGIEEIDRAIRATEELIHKIKDLAVDRDVFELEIKLLERLIITSEVIKDHRVYLNALIDEINKVITVPMLFAAFFEEPERYFLEIYWHKNPSEELKKRMEAKVIENITKSHEGLDVLCAHFVHLKSESLAIQDHIILKIKELCLDVPKIGGIVGIGVLLEEMEKIQEVAIQAILTSLLNVTGSVRAISKFTRELEYYATRDPLTHLYNQRVFWDFLNYEIPRAKRYDYKFSLIIIDLDNFKFINDTYGHAFGDRFLQRIAKVLESIKRQGDILARYGGDEFVLLIPMCDSFEAFSVAKRIRSAVNETKVEAPDGKTVSLTCSIGIAVYPDHGESAQDLFILADNLMYKAKEIGKNAIMVATTEEMVLEQKKEKEMLFVLKEAIEKKKIIPYFQPIYNLRTGELLGCELLMRLEVDGEIIPAGRFIPTAEKLGLIAELDYLHIEKALTQVKEHGYERYLFINLSPRFLIFAPFLERIVNLVKKINLTTEQIVFELTEREAVKTISLLQDFLYLLRTYGFKFSIDDFGSGFSTYQYIKHFSTDFVKLEGEFVVGLAKKNMIDSAIVESVVKLCQRLNIKIIAEYIENSEILQIVRDLGVDYGQGYFLGKPSALLTFPSLTLD